MPYPSQIDPETLGARALELVEERGWEDWSLRDVAAAVGVSPNALYRHVPGKQGLHVAIGIAAVRELHAALDEVVPSRSPAVTVVRMTERYVRFAIERPAAYQAFMTAKPDEDDPGLVEWMRLWVRLHEAVGRAVPDSTDAAAFTLWAFVHGRVELARGAARLTDAASGLEDGVRAILAGFVSRGRVPSPLPEGLRGLAVQLR